MNDETVQKITTALEQLAAKLGVAGEHLWEVLVRQVGVTAVAHTIAWLIGAAACAFVAIHARSMWKKWDSVEHEKDDEPVAEIFMFILSTVGVTLLFGALVGRLVPEVATALANPEYAALQNVIRMLR